MRFEIDSHLASLRIIRQRHQFIDLGFLQDDQQQPVFGADVEENIGETRRDYTANAKIVE